MGADWGRRADYLQIIDPAQLPVLFKQSLTGPVLAGMLNTALGRLIMVKPHLTMSLLEGLTTVPRFSMAVMLLSRADKANIVALWELAEDNIAEMWEMDMGKEAVRMDNEILSRLAAIRGVYKL